MQGFFVLFCFFFLGGGGERVEPESNSNLIPT